MARGPDDDTEVLESEPSRCLVLQARTRPVGEARVEITLRPDATGTVLSISEDFVSGPALAVPGMARGAALTIRNTETLRGLALLAERRDRP